MLIVQNVSYLHPNRDVLFEHLSFTINSHDKIALIGNNGTGKSTLLKLIASELQPAQGQIIKDVLAYYVPQIFGQYNHLTIAQALRVDEKLNALNCILAGAVAEQYFALLNDDWTIEERCEEALKYWQLDGLDLQQKMDTLSGGQKTKVFLAGIMIHEPELILLDEPGNHLDADGRKLLAEFIRVTKSTLLVVSHDRSLLNQFNTIYELDKKGVTVYSGNYDFYLEQKQIASDALCHDIQSREKALKKAREKERETMERQQKLDSRGKGRHEKEGVARIMMNTLRNQAEKSTAKIKSVHAEKIGGISNELQELRAALSDSDKMKFGFDNSTLHRSKVLFAAKDINLSFASQQLWPKGLSFEIRSGERIALKGANGSGKTTLIKLLLGALAPQSGTLYRAVDHAVYIDQDYSLINDNVNVYAQAEQYNTNALQEHEIKIRLNRFLFTKSDWDKPCHTLSGGERMRLMLCCLSIGHRSPDLIVLDEPTNNLDIQNIEILTTAINEYQGTLIVVSHDETFLAQTNIVRIIEL